MAKLQYLLAFLLGVGSLALTQWALSDRTGKLLSQAPRKIQTVVTVYVKDDPTKAIPGGSVSEFLKSIVDLKDEERRQIIDGAASGFITQVRLTYLERLPQGGERHSGIVFDVIDGKFAKEVGTFTGQVGR